MNSKISSLKEKMKQALTSTMKVISEDYKIKNEKLANKDNNKCSILLAHGYELIARAANPSSCTLT